jgi:hypothetical protein
MERYRRRVLVASQAVARTSAMSAARWMRSYIATGRSRLPLDTISTKPTRASARPR